MATTGLSTASFYNNVDYLNMNKPSKQRFAYKDVLGNYDDIQSFIDMMNPVYEREDNKEYSWWTESALRVPLPVVSNSSLLPNQNLLVTVSVPTGMELRNTIRETEVWKDNNNTSVMGRVEKVGTDTVELSVYGETTTWNPAIHFVADSFMGVVSNAQTNNSGAIGSLYNVLEETNGYIQTMRENHQVTRDEILKPSWAKYYDLTWSNSDISRASKRYFQFIAETDYYGQLSKSGSGSNTIYGMEGIRQAVKNRNPEGFIQLQSPLTEEKLQEIIVNYVARTNGAVNEVVVSLGAFQMANIQGFLAKYVETAGVYNTFGGYDVSGINIVVYNFVGLKLAFRIAGFFTNGQTNKGTTVLGDGNREGYTMFMHTNQLVETSDGMKPWARVKHQGPKSIQAGFLRGIVEPELINPNMVAGAGVDPQLSPVISANDSFTYYVYGTRSLELDPKYLQIVEYAI